MKLLLWICVAVVTSAKAEDLTLQNGKVMKDVTVTGIEADGIKIATDAGLARLKFWELSAEAQKRFGYDVEARTKAEIKALNAAAKAEAEKTRTPERPEGVRLSGQVVQVLKGGGLLVQCVLPRSIGTDEIKAELLRPVKVYGSFLVIGHPLERSLADDDWIDIDGAEDGVFRFTSVLGAARTVKKVKVVNVVR